jgi:hypothetical protein
MQVCEFVFTARFAQDAEDAKDINFIIAVERTAMIKCSAARAAETTKGINSSVERCLYLHFITRRFFSAFRRLSEKQKKTLRSLRLCGEKIYKDPFRVTIKPPFSGMVIDASYYDIRLKVFRGWRPCPLITFRSQ